MRSSVFFLGARDKRACWRGHTAHILTQRSDLCGFLSRTGFRLLNRALNIEGMPGQ